MNHKELFVVMNNPNLLYVRFFTFIFGALGWYIYFFKLGMKKTISFLFIYTLLLFYILSVLFNQVNIDSYFLLLFYILIFGLLPLFIYLFKQVNDFKNLFIQNWLAIGLFTMVIQYLQYIALNIYNFKFASVWPIYSKEGFLLEARYGSIFWDINHYGAYLSSLSFIMLYQIAKIIIDKGYSLKHSFQDRKIQILSFLYCLILISLLLTKSRSSLFGLVLSFIILFIISQTKRFMLIVKSINKIRLTFLIILILSVGIYSIAKSANQLNSLFQGRSESIWAHKFLLEQGVKIAADNPIFGIGLYNFKNIFKELPEISLYQYVDPINIDNGLPLHSIWIELMAETGIASFILYITFIIVFNYLFIVRQKKNQSDYFLLAGLNTYFISGIFYSYRSEFFIVYFMFLLAYFESLYEITFQELINRLDKQKDKLMLFISFLTFIIPFFLIDLPINESESFTFISEPIDIFSAIYIKLIEFSRFIFGSLDLSGRIISLAVYIINILLLIGIYKKRMRLFDAVIVTVVTITLLSVFLPVIQINVLQIHLTVGLFLLYWLLTSSKKIIHLFEGRELTYYVVLLLFLPIMMFLSNYQVIANNSETDLQEILEILSAKKQFYNTNIYTDLPVSNTFMYYCNKIEYENNTKNMITKTCDINEFKNESNSTYITFHETDIYSSDLLKTFVDLNNISKINRLDSGKYSVYTFIAKED